MFDDAIRIGFAGIAEYDTSDDSRLLFAGFFDTTTGVMFFNNNKRDSRIGFDTPLLPPIMFGDFYSFYGLFVSIVNYFYILSIFAISIKAIFRCL